MAKPPSNFDENYPKVIKWLKKNGIPFEEYNGGQHLKILGATAAIELWPGNMKWHGLMFEDWRKRGYHAMSRWFSPTQLDKVLNE